VEKIRRISRLRIRQSHVALTVKIAAIALATLVLFSQDLAIIFNDALRSETTSHILAIPIIFTYLIYRKRKMLRAVTPLETQGQPKETKHLPTIAGILLSTTAILLYWYGSYTFTPLEYHMSALPIFAAGLTLILFNPQTLRQVAFPTAFLILLTPPPSEILYGLGSTLSIISSEASNSIINALGVPSTLSSEYGNPTILITRPNGATISFAVDIACSGIYSLIGFLIFAAFIAFIIRDRPWKKLALFLVGLPLIYLLNIIRITSILLIGYHYGEETALQIFHLLGGWTLIFLGTLLLIAISEKIFKMQIFAKPAEKCPKCNPKTETKQSFCLACGKILTPTSVRLARKDLAKILAVTVLVILIMSIQAPVFALTQSPAMVIINTPAGQQVSTAILPEISGYELDFIYRDTRFEEIAKQDMALLYRYMSIDTPANQSNKPVWVTIEIASTRYSLHTWEACLITWRIQQGYQPRATEIELKEVQLVENPPIFGRYFVFQYITTNETQAVLYWFETTTFAVNSTSQQKHVKTSLIVYPDDLENLTSLENQLLVAATAIANYWQPIKTWSQITLFLSQNGNKLVTATIAMLVVTIIFYIFERRKERKMNSQTYKKLPTSSKQIIDATHETEKTTISTLNNIATAHQNKTGQPVDKEKLLHDLSSIEKTSILKRVITNRNDEPILIWKTQMAIR
jgi:exosortase